ncbi:Pycsar system effector family protein [Joostella sp. CR20]|uniref:Pycsar system effector family protein n=1 Tax=Joostella sp. CR20 TaxID=2804312 RepID=UPI00313E7AB8
MEETILQQAELFVTDLFEKKLSPKNKYHNLMHTQNVVSAVTKIATYENCQPHDIFLLQLAAWFHDTGYTKTDVGHEAESIIITADYLNQIDISAADKTTVEKLILATKPSVPSTSKLEQIIKDADCSHVASEEFFEVSEQLRLELIYKKEEDITELEWLYQNKEFLDKHAFYTESAKLKLQPQKEINAYNLQQRINKIEEKRANKAESKKTGRGVETLFRVQLKNHIELSSIADTKANILLSVNAIIISVVLSSLVPKLDNESNLFLVYPTLILLTFSVISIVLSVISTRPNVSNVTVTKDMIVNNSTNILFFGNFYKMSLKDFEWGIDYLINNEDTLYNSLTKDLYFLGLVLERKYRLLRITYTVFMIGIVISAIAFVLSYNFFINIL